jgi:hypothetical protein
VGKSRVGEAGGEARHKGQGHGRTQGGARTSTKEEDWTGRGSKTRGRGGGKDSTSSEHDGIEP